VDNAQVNLDTATKNQQSATDDMNKSQITAPADGTILNVTKATGDAITAAGSTTGGQNATTGFIVFVPDQRTVSVTASITETDIAQVALGQTVSVTFDGVGDTVFTGKVSDIKSVPKVDNNGLVSYSVIAGLDTNDNLDKIMQGMTCTINFISKQVQNVLYIPYKAVYMEDGIQYVDIAKEVGATEKRQVKTGLSDGTNVEVSQGLQRGETVIVRSGASAAK
jgi:HlyD family secretion protein